MKTSTKRILSIGFAAICLIAAFTVYGSLIRPELTVIGEKRAEVASKQNLFNNQNTAVSEVQKLIAQFKSSATRAQDTVSHAIPIGESTTEALNQWQAIARASGVRVQAFSLKPLALEPTSKKEPLAKRLGVLEMNTTVEGSYDSLKEFLRSLERNVRVANTRGLSVSPVIGSFDRYTLVITVEMYYQEP